MRVRVRTTRGVFEATLNGAPIAREILDHLPIRSTVQRWGEEIYFDVPVRMVNTHPTREVAVGDIAYWPEGPSVCIFFGKTPASTDAEPRPASDITIIGHTTAPARMLRGITEGAAITVERARTGRASSQIAAPHG